MPSAELASRPLRICLFGSLRLRMGDVPVKVTGLPKTAPLLAYLLLHPRGPISRQSLAFTLWPDSAESEAKANLRRHLYDLRRMLPAAPDGCPWLMVDAFTVQWNPDAPATVDVHEFERLAALPDERAAAALYTDDLLPDLYEAWIGYDREQLRERYFSILDDLMSRSQDRGDTAQAIAFAQQILRRDPLREETTRVLMGLHVAAGNRAGALKKYQRFKELLAAEMGVTPMPETIALAESIGRDEPVKSPPPTLPAVISAPIPSKLPAQVTPFLGRSSEVAAISELLARARQPLRLLTLTGPGGTGKTRLSLEVGAHLLKTHSDRFPDGIHFVGLSTVVTPDLVIPAIAATLEIGDGGLSLKATLLDHLRSRRLLLILDNFEHLIDAAPQVSELLTGAPSLSVLTTSREVLHLYGEQEFRVPPLPLPTQDPLPAVADLMNFTAIDLFVRRALAVRADFQLTPENADAVVEICAQVDGLPLAIELAAARLRTLSPQAILSRLSSRLGLLVGRKRDMPDRQQTLRATLDWSHNLLTDEEKALFADLSVFAAPFTLEAAEAVRGGDIWETLDLLESLTDKSLLRQEGLADGPRFRMLFIVREYAAEGLAASGRGDAVRGRLARFLRDLTAEAEPHFQGSAASVWLGRLDLEHDNIRAALHWCLQQSGPDLVVGLEMAAVLDRFWFRRGYWNEGRSWLERALVRGGDAPPALRARLMHGVGLFFYNQGRVEEAESLFDRSLPLYAQAGKEKGVADSLYLLGHCALKRHDYARATALYTRNMGMVEAAGNVHAHSRALENLGIIAMYQKNFGRAMDLYTRSLALARQQGSPAAISIALNSVGELARLQGDYARAKDLFVESLEHARSMGDRANIAAISHNLGYVNLRLADPRQAAVCFSEAATVAQAVGYGELLPLCVAGFGAVAAAAGRSELSAKLFGAASALLAVANLALESADLLDYEHHLALAKAQMANSAFAAAWAEGASLSLQQALGAASELIL